MNKPGEFDVAFELEKIAAALAQLRQWRNQQSAWVKSTENTNAELQKSVQSANQAIVALQGNQLSAADAIAGLQNVQQSAQEADVALQTNQQQENEAIGGLHIAQQSLQLGMTALQTKQQWEEQSILGLVQAIGAIERQIDVLVIQMATFTQSSPQYFSPEIDTILRSIQSSRPVQ